MKKDNLKIAALLSYLTIIVDSLYGVLIIPYLISKLGMGEYGVYKIVTSFSGSLLTLDLGINGTMIRFISKYRAEKDEKSVSNFAAIGLIICGGMIVLVAIVATIIFGQLPKMYGDSLSSDEFNRLQQLFVLMVINVAATMISNAFNGIIGGMNGFAYSQTVGAGRMIFRCVGMATIVTVWKNSIGMLLIDLIIVNVMNAFYYYIIKKRLKLRIHLYYWNSSLFREAGKYTGISFIQSILNQFNGNLDNMVIGSLVGAAAVSVYSVGLTFYTMFSSIATALSNIMLPTVTKILHESKDMRSVEDLVIRTGRIQFILLGAAYVGFWIVGREFLALLYSVEYFEAWYVALILMTPTLFSLIINVCLSVLRAKNKLTFQTLAYAGMVGFNFAITFFGVKYFGIVAAAIGTAFSLVIVKLVLMTGYYIKVIHIDMFRVYAGIFHRLLIPLIVAGGFLFVVRAFLPEYTWGNFIVEVIAFCLVYAVCLLTYGLNENEKSEVFSMLRLKKYS